MTQIIGLTGGIATGKTSVANYLKEKGLTVVDVDQISKEMVQPGQEGLEVISQHFGPRFLTAEGRLNRKMLGEIVFSDPKKRKYLNQLLHPIIFKELDRRLQKYKDEGKQVVVVDLPLLFETNYEKKVDQVIVVYTDQKTQLHRLIKRNKLSVNEAQNRINAQMSIDKKVELADVVWDNSKGFHQTQQLIDEWLKTI